MAHHQSFEIESINETGVGVRVRFTWRDDRFGHTIYFVRGETEIACVASCEGGSSDDWPPSPPIQEIHEQQNGDGKILFLTGMAGTGHWSMTVEVAERIFNGNPSIALFFDVAVRLKSLPVRLGSCYETVAPAAWIDMPTTPNLKAVGSVKPSAAMMFYFPDDHQESLTWSTDSGNRRLLNPHLPEEIHQPTTIQWSYGVASAIV